MVEDTCELNPVCAAAGLEGACCPTNTGFGYLDCCETFPETCVNGNSEDCTVTTVVAYQMAMASGAAGAGSVPLGLLLGVSLVLAVLRI